MEMILVGFGLYAFMWIFCKLDDWWYNKTLPRKLEKYRKWRDENPEEYELWYDNRKKRRWGWPI